MAKVVYVYIRNCAVCGKEFRPRNPQVVTCSEECRAARKRETCRVAQARYRERILSADAPPPDYRAKILSDSDRAATFRAAESKRVAVAQKRAKAKDPELFREKKRRQQVARRARLRALGLPVT